MSLHRSGAGCQSVGLPVWLGRQIFDKKIPRRAWGKEIVERKVDYVDHYIKSLLSSHPPSKNVFIKRTKKIIENQKDKRLKQQNPH